MKMFTKNYMPDSYYDFLLLMSMFLVGMSMYFILQNKSPLLCHPLVKSCKTDKSVSLVLTKASVLQKKKELVTKKRIAKPKVVKKITPIKKEIVKTKPLPLVKKEEVTIAEEIVEEKEFVKEVEAQEEVIPSQNVAKPVFDAQMKEEFIAGLYKIFNDNKRYPKMAKRRHLEGVAYIQFTLLKDGRLVHTVLHKSCGHHILDRAALKLVMGIQKYKPIPDSVSLAALDLNIPIKYSRE